MARKIFINYRRDDSSPTAGRLRDRLAQAFKEDNVFMDVESIPAGVDFADYLKSQIASCDFCLVLIGPNWLDAKDERGRRRLDDPNDYVAVEIAAALTRNIRVVPVTIDGARLPSADELPDPIKSLVRRNAVDIRNAHFRSDVDALIEKIDSRAWWERRPLRAAGVVMLVLLAAWIGFALWTAPEQRIVAQGPVAAPPTAPPLKPAAPPKPAALSPPPPAQPTPNVPPKSAPPAELSTPSIQPQPPAGLPVESIAKFTTTVNRDIDGQDILQPDGRAFIPDLDLYRCAAQCDRNTLCVAFSFDRWKNACYLKNKIVTPQLDARSVSAVKKPLKLPDISAAPPLIETARNYRFRGQPSSRKRVSDFQACRTACADDSHCIAFSYLKAGGRPENCEMFSTSVSVEKYVADDSADSGFKHQSP